jgi:hypothetical protein
VKVWTRKAYEQLDVLGESLFCRPVADPQRETLVVDDPI